MVSMREADFMLWQWLDDLQHDSVDYQVIFAAHADDDDDECRAPRTDAPNSVVCLVDREAPLRGLLLAFRACVNK